MKFLYKDTAQIDSKELNDQFSNLLPYISKLQNIANQKEYATHESSINLPFDETLLKQVMEMKDQMVSPKLKYIIDIGIGGSNLGTKAVYDAIYGYYDVLNPTRYPKIIFADTNDSEYLANIQAFLLKNVQNPEEVLINAISKSGGTTESIANLEILAGCVKDFKERLVVTSNENTVLWKLAKDKNISVLAIPEKVGGRYSVLTAVGLFPLAASGINILSLLEGAMEARKKGLSEELNINNSALSAILLFLNYSNGKLINDSFFFHPELESLGKWYRQLMGESLGKQGKGITPTVSIGSTDLHSMGQLYLGGPKDKFFSFIWGEHKELDVLIPRKLLFPTVLDGVVNKSAEEIMSAIYEGIKITYKAKNVPFVEIVLEDIDEKSIGEFFQFKMIEMMYLGKLLNVNPFNQPDVESYKLETKRILKNTQ